MTARNAWICPVCQCTSKKGGNNNDTPVGTPTVDRFIKDNTTHKRAAPAKMKSGSQILKSCSSKDTQVLYELITQINDQLKEVLISVKACQSKLDENTKVLNIMDGRINTLETELQTLRTMSTTATLSCKTRTNNCRLGMSDIIQPDISSEMYPNGFGSIDVDVPGILQSTAKKDNIPINIPLQKPESGTLPVVQFNSNELPSTVSVGSSPPNSIITMPVCTTVIPQAYTHNPTEASNIKRKITKVPENSSKAQFTSIRGTAGPDTTTLKAVDPRKYLHLWNMASETDEVLAYMHKICSKETCSVEKLKSRGNYKSYKIGIPEADFDKCLSPELWPTNARIKEWRPFRYSRNKFGVNSGFTDSPNETSCKAAYNISECERTKNKTSVLAS